MSAPGRDLLVWLFERRILVADGAMGTALLSAGAPPGGCLEMLNLERPEAVAAVHRGHLEAGAEILQTNSFGASPARLATHGLEGRCAEINAAAVRLAREVAGADALVAGSIGPTGMVLEPLGALSARDALDGFRRQAAALAGAGCDLLVVETMTDLAEAALAVEACASTGLPVIASMTFETTPRGIFTVYGVTPERAAAGLVAAGARVVGTNCGTGPSSILETVRALRAATDRPLIAKPNAGLPSATGGALVHPESPGVFAAHVAPLVEAGAVIVGGCCGATSAHVRAVAEEVRRVRGRAV